MVREHGGDTFAQFPVLSGDLHLPRTDAGQATLVGADEEAERFQLLPGIYGVTVDDPLPFPFTFSDDTVTVTPGSSATVSPEHDEDAVRALLTETEGSAEAAATTAAEESVSNGTLPTDTATSFGRAGRGFHLASLTEKTPPSYADGLVSYHYTATFGAEQYNGSLDREWIPVEGTASVTVTIPINAAGEPEESQVAIDTRDLVWGSAG